ncbi:protein kinase [Telmatocola sphagniphila]|uniref:Protein kinase n=1 Tax=Telmatocola sphagniphila TaxID=1123043 RepID=A0A8E6B8U3_9BACT|nr:FHA domain-containing serine/threonine-protein kinase [Telmatocola sphagniphila]QVL33497.1 protein kinase [Telmatocola sphagniphila]
MPKQILVLDATNRSHFFLALKDGKLSAGGSIDQPEIVLSNLKILNLECEVELEDEPIVVSSSTNKNLADLGADLQPNSKWQFEHLEILYRKNTRAEIVPEGNRNASKNGTDTNKPLRKRLLVIEGADSGKAFPLNDPGRTTIGNNQKTADIVLHDLYVARMHCEILVKDDRITVTHLVGKGGTLVNTQEVMQADLQIGDVLRVGNTQLRYDIGVVDTPIKGDADKDLKLTDTPSTDLKDPIVQTGTDLNPPLPADADSDPILKLTGQKIGHFILESLLGRGLTSAVYKAKDCKTDEIVTLKVMSSEFPDNDTELQNFIKALRVVAPLRHAHLVSLFTAGKSGHLCWIAREYIEGENLGSLIERQVREGKHRWKNACRLAIHLGRVLDYLEQRKVVHANLIPANVLIESETKNAKLADLMLDQAIAGSQLGKSILEKQHMLEIGYRAPEQLKELQPVDNCSNMYALGAMLYTMITGSTPFKGTNAADLIRNMKESRPAKPSQQVRELPLHFENAIFKLLAFNREERFQCAAEFLEIVEPLAHMHEVI